MKNVTSHIYSIVMYNKSNTVSLVLPVIKKFTEVPCKQVLTFYLTKDDIRSFTIKIVEGESTIPDECTELGKIEVRDLPSGLPKGTKVEVTFEFDKSSILQASVKAAGKEGKAEIKVAGGLSTEEVKAETSHIQKVNVE